MTGKMHARAWDLSIKTGQNPVQPVLCGRAEWTNRKQPVKQGNNKSSITRFRNNVWGIELVLEEGGGGRRGRLVLTGWV